MRTSSQTVDKREKKTGNKGDSSTQFCQEMLFPKFLSFVLQSWLSPQTIQSLAIFKVNFE